MVLEKERNEIKNELSLLMKNKAKLYGKIDELLEILSRTSVVGEHIKSSFSKRPKGDARFRIMGHRGFITSSLLERSPMEYLVRTTIEDCTVVEIAIDHLGNISIPPNGTKFSLLDEDEIRHIFEYNCMRVLMTLETKTGQTP